MKGQAYLSSFLSPACLHLHNFPLHFLSLFFLVLFLVQSSFLISLPTLTIFDVLVLLVCFICHINFYFELYVLLPFSVVLFSLFIVPQYSKKKPETIKTTNAPNHRNIGILAFPCPCQCLLKHFLVSLHFFVFWFCLFDVCFVCFGFTSSCCFQNKICVLGCCWFLFFCSRV